MSPEVYRQHGHLRYALAVNNQLQGYVVQVQLAKGTLDLLMIEEATIPKLDLLQVVETYEVRSRFDRL